MTRKLLIKSLLATGLLTAILWSPQLRAAADPLPASGTSETTSAAGSAATGDNQTSAQADQTSTSASSPSTGATGTSSNNSNPSSSSSSDPTTTGSNTGGTTSGTSQQNNGSQGGTQQSTTDTQTSANITNKINSNTQSGDATVKDSRQGGNATSGSALADATLVNTIQSSVSADAPNGGPQQFTYNITGDHAGDITLDPTAYLSPGAYMPADSSSLQTIQAMSSINNYLTLLAASGNAKVTNNKVGGSASSGDATAEANLINLINSSISSGQLFLGNINIYGTLDGNILIPQSLVNALLGNPASTGNGGAGGSLSSQNTYNINNDVTLLAQSGQAMVANNGYAGNATSGNALTNLLLYNLINSDIVGNNLLLVFVNVFGSWNGTLFNEPAGTYLAAIGNGIQQYSANPLLASSNITNTETINNMLYLSALSGNATVTNNRYAGNATSGNAIASADIINILGDEISLSGWLGVLFINVFGNWQGSLLTTQPLVNLANIIQNGPGDPAIMGSPSSVNHGPKARLAAFVYYPHQGSTFDSWMGNTSGTLLQTSGSGGHSPSGFGYSAANTRTGGPSVTASTNNTPDPSPSNKLLPEAAALMVFALMLLATERGLSYRHKYSSHVA